MDSPSGPFLSNLLLESVSGVTRRETKKRTQILQAPSSTPLGPFNPPPGHRKERLGFDGDGPLGGLSLFPKKPMVKEYP